MLLVFYFYSVTQSDGNSWKIDAFREAITTNDLNLIIKPPARQNLCLAKVIFYSEIV